MDSGNELAGMVDAGLFAAARCLPVVPLLWLRPILTSNGLPNMLQISRPPFAGLRRHEAT